LDIDIFATLSGFARSYGKENPVYYCMSKSISDEKLGKLLGYFDEKDTRKNQIAIFKKLMNDLQNISVDITKSDKECGTNKNKFAKKFNEN
jgi:hypothetical protein